MQNKIKTEGLLSLASHTVHYEQVSKWSRRGFFCFCLGIDCLSFGLGLDSVSTSPGLGLDKGGLDYSPGRNPPG